MNKTDKIRRFTAPIKEKSNIYILRGPNGDLMIDTGIGVFVHELDRWIRENQFDIKWIFLTHGHFDHTSNALFFKRKYGSKVILHEKDRDIFCKDESRTLLASSHKNEQAAVVANEVRNKYWAPYCRVDYFLSDNDTDFLRKLGFDADVVMLPGHTYGSMGVLQGKVLYCGDAVSAKKGDYHTTMFGENVKKIYQTERKIINLAPTIIAPGHGQLIIYERTFDNNKYRKAIITCLSVMERLKIHFHHNIFRQD